MQADVFEDFASDDGFGSDFDDGEFSDEQIANVLDLMAESSTARLSAVGQEDAAEDCSESHAAAVAGSGAMTTAEDPDVATQTRSPSLARDDERAQVSHAEQHPPRDAWLSRNTPSAALSLLEELFPSPRSPSDTLAASVAFESESVEQTQPPGASHEHSAEDKDVYNPSEQPEWMRELLGDIHAGSTRAQQCLSPIREEVLEHSVDEVQALVPSQDQDASAETSPEEQPSWMSLLDEVHPAESQQLNAARADEDSESRTARFTESAYPTPIIVHQESASERSPREAEPALQIDTTRMPARDHYGVSSISSSLDGNLSCSPLAWGKFSSNKMPVRHASESLDLAKTGGKQQAKSCKRLCYVPFSRAQKRRVRSRVVTPAESELTFRPKINSRYLKCLHSRRKVLGEAFSRRMEKDIQHRHERKSDRERAQAEKRKTDEDEQAKPKSLIAKGSARILQRNGLWEEPLETRLKRLMHGQGGAQPQRDRKTSEKRKAKREKRRQRAEVIASRACESLYQRGLDKKRRDQKRQQETSKSLQRIRARPKMTLQSQRVMKKKLRHELELVCSSRQRQPEANLKSGDELSQSCNSKEITFVEFSCALLYFGLVPDLDTPWRSDDNVTLLWYAWRTFVKEAEGSQDKEQRTMSMDTLERILGSVMLEGNERGDFVKADQALLQALRINYLSRKRSQTLEIRKMYDSNDAKAAHHTRDAADKPASSSMRSSQKYTLHGKPVAREGGVHDPLAQRQQFTEAKLCELRRQKKDQEVAECTFQPRITTTRSSQSSEWSCDLRLLSVYGRQYKSAGNAAKSTFERLYSDAFQRQNNVLEKYFQAKLEEEERFKKEAAISPSFVNGLTIEERLRNLQAALASNPLPVSYHKKIDSMRSAAETRAQESAAKALRLLPVQFQKSADGRTIVVPFHFATDMRASQAPLTRRGGGDQGSKKKTRAAVRNAVSKLRESEIRPELDSSGADQHQDPASPEAAAADFCLDVHLSPSEVRQLYFNAGDEPSQVSAAFAKRHRLHKEQELCLIGVIEANLEKLLDLHL